MSVLARMRRHARLSLAAMRPAERQTPPFLILYVNSRCNLTCEHCFYWRQLNRPDDLELAEYEQLSRELGRIENLNLCGGEPFLRDEFADICSLFIENNGVQRIYVPTNGYFTDRTERAIRQLLHQTTLQAFVCEISLDGMPGYHNKLRGNVKSFQKAIETCERLATLQEDDDRVRTHAISTATSDNLDEIRELTTYLHERFPHMEHHNLAVIRGDRKNPSLTGPDLDRYQQLHGFVAEVWKDREKGRLGSIVEPMLQRAKCKTMKRLTQVVPCTAGKLTGVVYANGDVSLCETHAPLGNLRQKSFFEIWDSAEANELRQRIRAKECYCTNEVFLWPSVVFQPVPLVKSLLEQLRPAE